MSSLRRMTAPRKETPARGLETPAEIARSSQNSVFHGLLGPRSRPEPQALPRQHYAKRT